MGIPKFKVLSSKFKENGFSFIEVLVALLIVGVLATVVGTSLIRSLTAERQAQLFQEAALGAQSTFTSRQLGLEDGDAAGEWDVDSEEGFVKVGRETVAWDVVTVSMKERPSVRVTVSLRALDTDL
ncbi:MAG: type II secretion system GspH family protein [Verrucomicrobia bacterium]|nr:type II secretion system GspH family protein [Verrucomicrobiota bacterium]